nr:hypothetical protein [Sphingorhabdus sp.]
SVTFAFLVLFSSSSFMVGVHLCGGHVQNVALFTQADACEMEKQMPPCHKHQSKPCCEDESIVHQGDSFKVSLTDVSIAPAHAAEIALPSVQVSEVIPTAPFSRTRYHHYDPPLRTDDLTVSLQVFLI